MWSVRRRRRLASHARMRWWRDSPASFGPVPMAKRAFVASRTSSRRPWRISPRISSERPSAYMSAVSMRLTPASSAWSTRARASRMATPPRAAAVPASPKVIVPRASSDTRRPLRPSCRYSTPAPSHVSVASTGATVRRPRQPWRDPSPGDYPMSPGVPLSRCPHLPAGKEATHVLVVGVGGDAREGAHREDLPGCVAGEAKPLSLTGVAVVGAHQHRGVRILGDQLAEHLRGVVLGGRDCQQPPAEAGDVEGA